MLHYVNGDLLESDCTVIMHQANCLGIMGAGIAKAIAQKYPKAALVDKNSIYKSPMKYGKFTYSKEENGVTVANLYGQFELGPSKTEKIKIERERMLRHAINFFLFSALSDGGKHINLKKVGVPYKIGCGIAGGDWENTVKILEEASRLHKIDIFIYKLQ